MSADVLHWLAAVPQTRPVALLLRHSVRDPLPAGELGYDLALNDDGVLRARQLAQVVGERLRSVHSSPLQRCLDTAGLLAAAAPPGLAVVTDRMLGDPGAYVVDRGLAGENWKRLGSEGIMERLCTTDEELPGTLPARVGAQRLVEHMLAVAGARAGLHVFVTHDILLAITAARFLGPPAGPQRWPAYLEGAFFWRDADGLHAAYRDRHRGGISAPD